MSWPMVKLGDVAPAKPLKNVSADADEEVWHLNLDMVEAQSGKILQKIYAPVADAGISTHWFDDNYVLYSKLRPYLNKVVLPNEKGLATTELVLMLPDPKRLDRKYLAYYLRSNSFVSWISEQVAGAKMPRVSMNIFWQHEIPLPPLEEQKRIAAILDKAEAIRQKRQQAIELADEFVRSVFLDMFGDPVTNPKGWEVSKLGDCCSLQGGYAFKSEDFSDKGIPLVKITNVHFENIDWSDRDFVPEEFLEQKSDFSLNEGDLIMAMTRPIIKSLNSVKIIEVKQQDLPCLLNQRVGRFKEFDGKFEKEFFKHFIYSNYFKNEVDKLCSVALQPNVSSKQIESIKCFIPPKDLQREFAVIKQHVDKIMYSFTPFNNLPLFESLSKKAFSGDL